MSIDTLRIQKGCLSKAHKAADAAETPSCFDHLLGEKGLREFLTSLAQPNCSRRAACQSFAMANAAGIADCL